MTYVVDTSASKTLVKAQLLENEAIVAEFVEEPVCNNFCRSGVIRRVQLTTHRVNYLETYHKFFCFKTPPSMRQVFVKDICDIAIDNYRRVDQNWFKKLIFFSSRNGSPLLT